MEIWYTNSFLLLHSFHHIYLGIQMHKKKIINPLTVCVPYNWFAFVKKNTKVDRLPAERYSQSIHLNSLWFNLQMLLFDFSAWPHEADFLMVFSVRHVFFSFLKNLTFDRITPLLKCFMLIWLKGFFIKIGGIFSGVRLLFHNIIVANEWSLFYKARHFSLSWQGKAFVSLSTKVNCNWFGFLNMLNPFQKKEQDENHKGTLFAFKPDALVFMFYKKNVNTCSQLLVL